MSAPFLIIDGYNLLHSAGLARMQYGPGDLERARHRLLALLAEKLRADERSRCTVVFDAQQSPGDLPQQAPHHGITITFAPCGQDADTVIEQMIARHPASRRMIMVSGDHRLQQAAKRRNATPLDSDTFLKELEKRESISPHKESTSSETLPSQRSQPTSHKSTTEWEKIFGAIDVAAIAQDVSRESLSDSQTPASEVTRIEELQRQLNDPGFLERWLNEPPDRI